MRKKIFFVFFIFIIISFTGCSFILNNMIDESDSSSQTSSSIPIALKYFDLTQTASNEVKLSWNSVDLATSYEIFLDRSLSKKTPVFSEATTLGSTKKTYTYITDLSTYYYYYVWVIPTNKNGSTYPIYYKTFKLNN